MRMLVMTVKACVLLAATPYLVAEAKTAHPVKTEQTITTKAKVESVNQDTREVTLKKSDGSKVTIKVPDTVRNLAQVKPGDTVKAKYSESIALDIRTGKRSAVGSVNRDAETSGARSDTKRRTNFDNANHGEHREDQ